MMLMWTQQIPRDPHHYTMRQTVHASSTSWYFWSVGRKINAQDRNGFTPLVNSIYAGHAGVVQLLLSDDRLDPNLAVEGYPPVHHAVFSGWDSILRLLCDTEIVDLSQVDSSCRTALNASICHASPSMMDILLSKRSVQHCLTSLKCVPLSMMQSNAEIMGLSADCLDYPTYDNSHRAANVCDRSSSCLLGCRTLPTTYYLWCRYPCKNSKSLQPLTGLQTIAIEWLKNLGFACCNSNNVRDTGSLELYIPHSTCVSLLLQALGSTIYGITVELFCRATLKIDYWPGYVLDLDSVV